MNVVEIEPAIVVGVSVRAAWNELWVEMPKAWKRLIERHEEIAQATGRSFVDVSLEKNGDEYHQLIGRVVSRVDGIPDGMRAVGIPAQRMIHHRHVGPTREIAASFGEIYEWADENGLEAGEFKLDFGYTAKGDEREHDLFVGLLPAMPWRAVGE